MKAKYKQLYIYLFALNLLMITGCGTKQPVIFETSEIANIDNRVSFANITPVQVHASEADIESEAEYNLIHYAELVTINDEPIEKGDIVTLQIYLYDENNNSISTYAAMGAECIVGDYEYDPYIEELLIGRKAGDQIDYIESDQTIYANESVAYCSFTIDSVERYLYPELTEAFLLENFQVKDEKAFYSLMKDETEAVMYRMELEDTQNELIKNLEKNITFRAGFEKKVEERYQQLISKYEKYGELYNMSLDEVLSEYDLSLEIVKQNARTFQLEWELVKYYIEKGEITIDESELEKDKQKYAIENGYQTVQELIKDSGEQYLLEEVLVGKMKDYVYEKYVGEINRNECTN